MLKSLLILSIVLAGCSQKRPDKTKTWLSVESPPTRVILLADTDMVNSDLICRVIRDTKVGKYQNYPFNSSISISANAEGVRTDTHTDTVTDTKSISIATPATP